MKLIKLQNKNSGLRIFSFLEEVYLTMDLKEFEQAITKKLGKEKAGFKKKQYLLGNIRQQVFNKSNTSLDIQYNPKDIDSAYTIIKKAFKKASTVLPSKNTNIYVFPTRSSFIIKHMNGVSGYSPSKNNLLIYVNFKKGWQKQLSETVVHEYTHTLSYQHHTWQTLLDSLIFEGLAEHFTQKVLKRKPSKLTRVFNIQKSKQLFKTIKSNLNSKSYELYADVFFGSKKFPTWAGYTIGYNIVSDAKKFSKLDWSKLIKTSPQQLLKASKWE